MESILEMVFNADNVRMLVVLAFAYCGYIFLKGQIKDMNNALEKRLTEKIDGVECSLEKNMDEKLLAFHAMLKSNDFAHLHHAIEALTFTLEKNGFLQNEDKKYIDSRLDEK
ncbi:hypothetical protein R83H12_01137 [Fibrobacteria bacterium R8-3-H12]